jgi:hypothetical protein
LYGETENRSIDCNSAWNLARENFVAKREYQSFWRIYLGGRSDGMDAEHDWMTHSTIDEADIRRKQEG